MIKQKKLSPKRRFEGFTVELEEKKLEEVAPLQRGFDLTRSNMSKGPYPVIFSNGIGAWNSIYKIKGPGVITGRSGSIGNVSYVEQNYWPHNTSLWVTNFFENYPLYIYYLYEKVDLSKFGTGSGVPTLNRNDVHDYSVFVPGAKEQQKIGQFFKHLDDMIALQQRKMAKTKALKSAYLAEMFPVEGECVPKRRFEGFTDEWEEIKLKDIGKATGGTSIESEFVKEGKYKVISIGSYSEQSVYTDQNIRVNYSNKIKNRILNKNDLTMILNDKTVSGNIIGRVLLIDKDDTYVYNQRTARIEPNNKKFDIQFLYQLLNAPLIRSKIVNQAQGNTQIYVNWSRVEELEYLIPLLEEQKKIGEFFKQLDDIIATHEQKLDKLKSTKQAYLHEMFV